MGTKLTKTDMVMRSPAIKFEMDDTLEQIRRATPQKVKANVEEWRREHRQMISAESNRAFERHFNSVGDKLETVKVGK